MADCGSHCQTDAATIAATPPPPNPHPNTTKSTPHPFHPPSRLCWGVGGGGAVDGAHMAAADGGDCRYCSLCQRSWDAGELMIMQSADVLRSSPVVKQQQLELCVCVCECV